MAQQIINYGNTANDGTGDPLRDAFIKVDENFDQIWAAGPVGSNITVLNNTISVVNTNGNLILSPNGVGIIQTNRPLYPRLDNTYDLGSANFRYRSMFVGDGGITTDGNLILGNISDLKIPGGTNGYVIQTDGAGNLSWVALPGAGNGSPGGSNTQVQFNDGGLFGGANTFTFNKTSNTLTSTNISANVFTNINGNDVVIQTAAGTLGNINLLPDGNGIVHISGSGQVLLLISSEEADKLNRVEIDTFGTSNTLGGTYTGSFARGSLGSPQSLLRNDRMAAFKGKGYNGVELTQPTGQITIDASVDWSTANNGTHISFWTTADESIVPVETGRMLAGGGYVQLLGDITVVDGNIRGGGNTNISIIASTSNVDQSIWTFDTVGNLTLPDNLSSINYPSGARYGGVVQANVPPASPNDSTLWWDEITGRLYVWYTDQDGSQWVDAAPAQGGYGNSNVASYLAVGGVTTAISTTGNISGNYFVGNGSQLTGVTASTGNIGFVGDAIYDINGIYLENADLSHGATAALILPPNTGNIESIQLNNLYGNIILQAGTGSFTGSWSFNNTGNLTLPPGGNIVGATANNNGYLTWVGNSSGDGGGYTTMKLIPDDTRIGSDQYLIIDPTAPGHIHIRAGGTQDSSGADLILGGENSYVKVTSGLNPPVYVSANNYSWTFGIDGVFQAPGDISTSGNALAGNITASTLVTTPIPLANLTAVAGARAFVSDGNLAAAGNFGAQIGNAGSNVVPVYSDGANWYIG